MTTTIPVPVVPVLASHQEADTFVIGDDVRDDRLNSVWLEFVSTMNLHI